MGSQVHLLSCCCCCSPKEGGGSREKYHGKVLEAGAGDTCLAGLVVSGTQPQALNLCLSLSFFAGVGHLEAWQM